MQNISKMNKLFDYYILSEFCKKYNITKDVAINQSIYSFRLLCYKMNYFMKYVNLPKIQKNSLYEAVFVEFREFPHIEFIIRNAILKLGTEWSHTIICGNLNYNYIKNMCKDISKNINIVKVNVNNMTQSEYSRFLTTMDFWNSLQGEKILIYQEDSIIFKNNIQDFLQFDFIGAPFLKAANDTPNCVGNGGLSLRSKTKMLEIIQRFSPTEYRYNSSTLEYMNYVDLKFPPEDVYFSKCMQEQSIGIVANWDAAHDFSSESVFNSNSFGGHKFWISCENWKSYTKKRFAFQVYIARSDINKLLLINQQPLSFNLNDHKENAFDIDLYFFCKANDIQYTNSKNALHYFNKFALDGFIYHPKQIWNIFPNSLFYNFLDTIYIVNNFSITPLYDFVSKNLYNSSFDIVSDLLISKKYSCLNDNYSILILIFIGNEAIGVDLIERIIQYKNVQSDFNVAFCFNDKSIKDYTRFKKLIMENFDFYAIYKCKELGSDIIPTMLMYNIIIRNHNFEHIFKFHTKSVNNSYLDLTNFLLSKSLTELINENEKYMFISNCIGHPGYFIPLQNDYFNDSLKKKYASVIDFNMSFVGGTIFYTTNSVFDAILSFIKKNNYRGFLLNNLYENNTINVDFSPNHFLERLFGVIIV